MNNKQHQLTGTMLFSSLENNLHSLRKGLRDLYAGETGAALNLSHLLRNLVCESSGTDGVLWRVMEIVAIDDSINVPDMQKCLDEDPNNARASIYIPLMDHGVWQNNGIPLQLRSLKEYIKSEPAIRLVSKDLKIETFTPGNLIRTVAKKMGSHVDSKIPDFLAVLAALKAGDTSTLVYLIANNAMLVAQVGERAVSAAESMGFERRYELIDLPTDSLFHTPLRFDLDVPEADMSETRNMRIQIRINTAEAASRSRPPFRIGGNGHARVRVEVWVGPTVDISVFIYFDGICRCKYSFPYPTSAKKTFNVDVVWDDEKARVDFNGQSQLMARQ